MVSMSYASKRRGDWCPLVFFHQFFARPLLSERLEQAIFGEALVSGQLYLRPRSKKAVFLNSHTNSVFNIPVCGQLSLQPPSQKPVFLNSHANSVFLHSRKRPAPVTDTFSASRGCPVLTRASTVYVYESTLQQTLHETKLVC